MATADKGYMRAEGTFHIPGLAVRCRLCVCLLLLFFKGYRAFFDGRRWISSFCPTTAPINTSCIGFAAIFLNFEGSCPFCFE